MLIVGYFIYQQRLSQVYGMKPAWIGTTLIKGVYGFIPKLADKYKDDPRYRQIRAEAFRLENIQRRVGLKALRNMVHHLAERIQTAKKQTPSDQLDFHNDHSWLAAGLPDQQRDMLLANPSLVDVALTAYRLLDDPDMRLKLKVSGEEANAETLLRFFEVHLPEFFLPPPKEEPDYSKLLRIIEEFKPVRSLTNPRDFVHIASAVNRYLRERVRIPDVELGTENQ